MSLRDPYISARRIKKAPCLRSSRLQLPLQAATLARPERMVTVQADSTLPSRLRAGSIAPDPLNQNPECQSQ